MAGMAKTRALKHALGDRVGHYRAGPPGRCVLDRLSYRGHGGLGAGAIWFTGLCGCNLASGDHGQGVREHVAYPVGTNLGQLELNSKTPCSPGEQVGIAEPVKGRKLQLIATEPSLDGDVGSDTCGFA